MLTVVRSERDELTASPVKYSDSPPGNQLMVNQLVKLSSKPLSCLEEKTVPYSPTHLILNLTLHWSVATDTQTLLHIWISIYV